MFLRILFGDAFILWRTDPSIGWHPRYERLLAGVDRDQWPVLTPRPAMFKTLHLAR